MEQKQFYRRELPSTTCVKFSSEQGKDLFHASLITGNANIYFKLAEQFRTQDEPAFCGLSTLVMVLNALEVDPGRLWKGPWRWYHESMLDCCQKPEQIVEKGINMEQFACLATCNRLSVLTNYCPPADIEKFRQDVQSSVTSEDLVLVVSYDRKVLGQTGTGHFSPIGALNSDNDKVLILDVARFKYPPHWVDLSLLHKAMQSVDITTRKTRGYFLMKLRPETRPLLLFKLGNSFACKDPILINIIGEWRQFLRENDSNSGKNFQLEEQSKIFDKFRDLFKDFAPVWCQNCSQCTINNNQNNQNQHDQKAECQEIPSKQQIIADCCRLICNQIRATHICKAFNEICQQPKESTCLAALFLAWPFQEVTSEGEQQQNQLVHHIRQLVREDMANFGMDEKNEIELLRTQINALINFGQNGVNC